MGTNEEFENTRKELKRWAGVFKSIIENKSASSNSDFSLVCPSYSSMDVHLVNKKNNFQIYAHHGGDNFSKFCYGRKFEPFGKSVKNRIKNNSEGFELFGNLKTVFEGFDFIPYFGDDLSLIGFGGPLFGFYASDTSFKKFDDFVRLVNWTELAIEGTLAKIEKSVLRPYKYAIVPHQKFKEEVAIIPLKSLEDLTKAVLVFESHDEVLENYSPESPEFLYSFHKNEKERKDYSERFKGKFSTVEEFLKN